MKKSIIIKEVLLVFVTMMWGLGFVSQSKGGEILDANTFNFCRCLVAAISSILFVTIRELINKKKKQEEPQKETNYKNLWIGGILAGISLAAAYMFQQAGVMLEGAGKSGFLTALYIIFVPIFSIILGKKLNSFITIAIILSFTGLYLINVNDGVFTFSIGSVFLILCALGFAGQIIFIDIFCKDCDFVQFSSIQFCTTAIAFLPFALIFGNFDFTLIKQALPFILYLGIVSTTIADSLQVYAQTEVNVNIASVIMSLESVFALQFGMLILHEKHGFVELLGCIAIFIAVLLTQLSSKNAEK